MTPAQYYALSQRFKESRRFLDYEFGWTRAAILAPHRGKGARPLKIQDYMIYDSQTESSREMSWQEQLAHVRGVVIPALAATGKLETK